MLNLRSRAKRYLRDQLTNSKPVQVIVDEAMQRLREEFTVMPRFQYHQPLDYEKITYPVQFAAPTIVPGVELPVPSGEDRMGYCPDDAQQYLDWGKYDHDFILNIIRRHSGEPKNRSILDFGCSSGRVLRHFDAEHAAHGWQINGVDIQARPIEWMRYNFPNRFQVATCTTNPHLPFADGSFDYIYGISVFTHIKYLWDAWLLELKRVLKPGGLLMQTIHAEPAWDFYHKNRFEPWVMNAHAPEMLAKPKMDVDFLYNGDATVSQVFWKESVARNFWGRYFEVKEVLPPPERSFQNWMVCKKPE